MQAISALPQSSQVVQQESKQQQPQQQQQTQIIQLASPSTDGNLSFMSGGQPQKIQLQTADGKIVTGNIVLAATNLLNNDSTQQPQIQVFKFTWYECTY